MAPHAEIDNDDASSVYTLASQAPSIAPSVVAPSIASTATYHNAPEVKAVDEVEMMDLDASMSSKVSYAPNFHHYQCLEICL